MSPQFDALQIERCLANALILISVLLKIRICEGIVMSKQSLDLSRAEKMYRDTLCRPENLTVSFVYEGKRYEGLGQVPMIGKKVTGSETG